MDRDIQEMFKKKNREILINNLKLDIERSIEVLENTILNIFDKEFDSASRNINSMYEDSFFDKSDKKVDTMLSELNIKVKKDLSKLINDKKVRLTEDIDKLDFKEEEMKVYYDLVFSTTDLVIDYFKSDMFFNIRKDYIDRFYKYSNSKLDMVKANITNSRINDYITYRLFGKIEDRIKSEFLIRDNSLINKGKESYDKYRELEMRTTNK